MSNYHLSTTHSHSPSVHLSLRLIGILGLLAIATFCFCPSDICTFSPTTVLTLQFTHHSLLSIYGNILEVALWAWWTGWAKRSKGVQVETGQNGFWLKHLKLWCRSTWAGADRVDSQTLLSTFQIF